MNKLSAMVFPELSEEIKKLMEYHGPVIVAAAVAKWFETTPTPPGDEYAQCYVDIAIALNRELDKVPIL